MNIAYEFYVGKFHEFNFPSDCRLLLHSRIFVSILIYYFLHDMQHKWIDSNVTDDFIILT